MSNPDVLIEVNRIKRRSVDESVTSPSVLGKEATSSIVK